MVLIIVKLLNEYAGTRGHPFKLHKGTVLTNLNWNNLPSNIVLAEKLDSFKNLQEKQWEQKIFSTSLLQDERQALGCG